MLLENARMNHACVALLELSQHWETGELVKTKDISRENSLPHKYLTQILLQLRSAGLVVSVRGSRGGFRLARHPREITVWDVFQAVESTGRERREGKAGLREGQRLLASVWREAAGGVRETLEKYTFEDLRTAAQVYHI